MIDEVMDIGDEVLKSLRKRVDEGRLDRMDVKELADVYKDLNEAAQACSTVEAMERYGYMPDDMGYDDGYGSRGRRGYNRNRDSIGRYTSRRGYGSRGYHEHVEGLREQMQGAPQEEREQMKREIREMLGM